MTELAKWYALANKIDNELRDKLYEQRISILGTSSNDKESSGTFYVHVAFGLDATGHLAAGYRKPTKEELNACVKAAEELGQKAEVVDEDHIKIFYNIPCPVRESTIRYTRTKKEDIIIPITGLVKRDVIIREVDNIADLINSSCDLCIIKQIDRQGYTCFQHYAHGKESARDFLNSMRILENYAKEQGKKKKEYRYEVYQLYETVDENGLPMFRTLGKLNIKENKEGGLELYE